MRLCTVSWSSWNGKYLSTLCLQGHRQREYGNTGPVFAQFLLHANIFFRVLPFKLFKNNLEVEGLFHTTWYCIVDALTHTMFAGSKKTSFHTMNLLQEEGPQQQRWNFTVHHLPAKQSNTVSIMCRCCFVERRLPIVPQQQYETAKVRFQDTIKENNGPKFQNLHQLVKDSTENYKTKSLKNGIAWELDRNRCKGNRMPMQVKLSSKAAHIY